MTWFRIQLRRESCSHGVGHPTAGAAKLHTSGQAPSRTNVSPRPTRHGARILLPPHKHCTVNPI